MTFRPDLPRGGSFLLSESPPADIFTAEDLTEDHAAIASLVTDFWNREIEPNLKGILDGEPGLVRRLMRRAASLGLMAISVPEAFGGMELDLISALVVSEHTARDGSYMIWEGGHNTIGTLPIVYFGTAAQKARFLPRLARLELLSAYALTEPDAGSDALAVRTRADLDADGTHYVLTGQKAWISNAGEADLFTVFAKVDGRDFTAFLIERGFEGLRIGPEERKMGLKGSSTTALYLDRVRVPAENMLGEVGRGHIIAFNILNLGRLKMGASLVGAAREVLRVSIAYAVRRRAFGSPIAEFGAIRHKLAEMAVGIFATESALWRTAGHIVDREGGVTWKTPDAAATKLAAVREHAVECSIVKVFASEMLDYVVDEGVQIHGGYGYHQDYLVERAYRDSRINRIFEGTNEINRLLIIRMLVSPTAGGQRPILDAARAAMDSPQDTGDLTAAKRAKTAFLVCLNLAHQRWGDDLDHLQEVQMLLADIVIDVYVMESVLLRGEKIGNGRSHPVADDLVAVFVEDALERVGTHARRLVGASVSRNQVETWTDRLDALIRLHPTDLVERRRRIAGHLIDRGRYAL